VALLAGSCDDAWGSDREGTSGIVSWVVWCLR